MAHDESGAMAGLDARVSTAENYRRFARREVVAASSQYAESAEAVAADELGHVMRTRRTQTNEAARCAMLLPALAMVPGPV